MERPKRPTSRAALLGRRRLPFSFQIRGSTALRPLAVATALSSANSLAIAIVYARVGGAEPYGNYLIALAVVGVASLATLSGSSISASRAAAQGRVAAWGLFVARLPYCLAVSFVLLVGAGVVAYQGERPLAETLAAGAIILPVYVGGDVFPGHLLGAGLWATYLRYQAVVQVTSALVVIAAIAFAPGAPWLAVTALGGSIGLLQVRGLLKLRAACSATNDDHAYSRKLSGVAVVGTLDTHSDILLTGWILGSASTSILGVARFFPLLLRRIWEVFYPAVFATIAASPRGRALESVGMVQFPLVTIFLAFATIGIVCAPVVIPLLFGEEFTNATLVAQLLLAATSIASMGYLRMTFLRAHDVRRFAVLHGILLGTSLAILPPLLIRFEVNGIGLKGLAVAVVYIASTYVLAQRARLPNSKPSSHGPEAR